MANAKPDQFSRSEAETASRRLPGGRADRDKSLESWIRDAACSIRGAKDAPKYKDYILPLIRAVVRDSGSASYGSGSRESSREGFCRPSSADRYYLDQERWSHEHSP